MNSGRFVAMGLASDGVQESCTINMELPYGNGDELHQPS